MCRTWASPAHLASARHELAALRVALAGMHADLAAACAIGHPTRGPVIMRLAAVSVRDRLAALLAGGRDA